MQHQDNEDIYIDDDDEQDEGQPNQGGGGLMNFIGNFLSGW